MSVDVVGTSNGALHIALEPTLLDEVYEKVSCGQIDEGMNALLPGLKARRLAGLQHPLRELLHQDPFTCRAFRKPRGYAGDAILLDFIYAREEEWPPPDGVTELGARIYEYTTRSAACEGVRARRGFIADLLDRTAERTPRAHVMSVAAGHLREAELSAAVKRRRFGRFVALDSDRESLSQIERSYGRFGVETARATIRQLLTQKIDPGRFDVIYSTGLFDYLQHATAARLAWVLFQMLRPGGRLLVANFLPGISDLGYMESYMDWKLVYRTRVEMVAMSEEIPQPQIRDIRLVAEENQNIMFLQVTKA